MITLVECEKHQYPILYGQGKKEKLKMSVLLKLQHEVLQNLRHHIFKLTHHETHEPKLGLSFCKENDRKSILKFKAFTQR